MISLSYNTSHRVQENLSAIEALRKDILLQIIPPKVELRLRWEAQLQRIFWSLALADNPISKAEVAKLLANQTKKKLSLDEKEILNYKDALTYIRQDWFVNSKLVTPKTIFTLYDLACKPTLGSTQRTFAKAKKDTELFIDYLQKGDEHPVLKSGIAQIQIRIISPFIGGMGRVGRLTSYLYLYKEGYNFRDFLVIDEFFRRDLVAYREALGSVEKYKNLTFWLEYFTSGLVVQLKDALETINTEKYKSEMPASFWNLNERQRKIVEILEAPGERMTNKKVQNLFKISQITASRDLAKLASLGVLFSHGSGRSVYYTKV